MGTIRETSTGRTRILESDYLIGRVSGSLTLSELYVSGVHAEVRWTGQLWELRDLGSRNGTYLDGRRIDPTTPYKIGKGSRIAFGKTAQEWEVIDDSGPQVMAVPLDGGTPSVLEGELIALPSSGDPRATIYRTLDGSWVVETSDELPIPLAHRQTFSAIGRMWRFSCSEMAQATIATDSGMDLGLVASRLHLAFSISLDEEYVHLRATCDHRELDLGARRHNFLLVTLARRRLKDIEAGIAASSCGWIDVEELARDPSMAPPHLNIDVYRIREQFIKAGIIDGAAIIERRPEPRQLRIGTEHLSVKRI
jgi:hypothetical protein